MDSFLTKDEQEEIVRCIHEQELRTSGEIRLAVRFRRGLFEKNKSVHQVGLKEFYRLGMNKTKDKTGVLLFFLVDEREFCIIADEGIDKKVEPKTWEIIAGELQEHLHKKQVKDGILKELRNIGDILAKHFPRKSDDRDELTNEISMR